MDAKSDLRKSFEDLQAHSSSLASFTLRWKDLDDHCESIKNSINERFKKLESIVPQAVDKLPSKESPLPPPPQNPVSNSKQSSSAIVPVTKKEDEESSSSSEITPRPALMSLCIKMDWKGLHSYIRSYVKTLRRRQDLILIGNELVIAIKSAPDPAKLVLDAMQGFYLPSPSSSSKGKKDPQLNAFRKICILLLEQLTKISPQITPQVKKKAKKFTFEWKEKICSSVEYRIEVMEAIAFLQTLISYDLASAFNVDELLDFLVRISRRSETIDLIRALGLTEKIPDFIQKLTSRGKFLDAVKFVFTFDLADKFPPVPILETYIELNKKTSQEVLEKENYSIPSQSRVMATGIGALKAVIKCMNEYKLESPYLRGNLEKRREELEKQMEQFEKQKAERKRAARTLPTKQQMENKRPRPSPPASNPPILHTQLQQSSFLLDRAVSYYGTTARAYGLADQSSLAPFASSSSGLYGVAGNLSPARSHLYSSDSHPSGLYNKTLNYGGYGLPPPQYRPYYYP